MKSQKISNTVKFALIIILLIILLILIILTYSKNKNKIETFLSGKHSNFKVNPADRKILLIYTGGTIGMVETSTGYSPKKGYLEKQLKKTLDLHPKSKSKLGTHHVIEFDPLLDSSNMNLKDWNMMIKMIKENYDNYDAFIVLHGTDTMSYSASALSFAFQNLTKPIIFTGSQIPLQRLRNDGRNNIIGSLVIASNYNIPEVLLVFGDSIIRGNRSVKISSNKIHAFGSPNFSDLGAFGYLDDIQINDELIQRTKGNSGSLMNFLDIQSYNPQYDVFTFFLSPGTNFKALKDVINNNPNTKAVIIRTFGVGDGPTSNKEFLELLQFLHSNNIIVVNISQCVEGRIDQGDYAVGSILKKNHVISGQDLTFEAAYCKLLYLLSVYDNNNTIILEKFKENLAGELSNKLRVIDVDPSFV